MMLGLPMEGGGNTERAAHRGARTSISADAGGVPSPRANVMMAAKSGAWALSRKALPPGEE